MGIPLNRLCYAYDDQGKFFQFFERGKADPSPGLNTDGAVWAGVDRMDDASAVLYHYRTWIAIHQRVEIPWRVIMTELKKDCPEFWSYLEPVFETESMKGLFDG